MISTRLSSKGQVVIPKEVRDAQGWKEGTEFIVETTVNGVLLRPKRVFKRTTIEDVVGSAGYKGRRRTIKEMDEAIIAEAVRRYKRAVRK